MEVDTGSAVSIVSETTYKKLFQHLPLKPTHCYLKKYSGERLTLLRESQVRVTYQTQEVQLPLVAAEGDKPVLLGKILSKIDLSHACQQVELDDNSQKYLTINTHKGLYRYKRLPFGVSSAPAIFQRIMNQILLGVKFTVCRLADILISGSSPEKHLQILEEVFGRLQDLGIKLNPVKGIFFQPGLEFLRHWS